jgi:hypothetical protein
MQGYQRHTAPQGGHCPGALNLYPLWKELTSFPQRQLGRGRPAVPVCPGHVRRFHPYPPSRRRRQ